MNSCMREAAGQLVWQRPISELICTIIYSVPGQGTSFLPSSLFLDHPIVPSFLSLSITSTSLIFAVICVPSLSVSPTDAPQIPLDLSRQMLSRHQPFVTNIMFNDTAFVSQTLSNHQLPGC